LHDRVGTAGAEAIAAWVNERIDARFQRIDRVEILDDFPRNVAGKTLKRVLREMLQSRSPDAP